MLTKLTPEIVTAAIQGFEDQKRHIDGQIAELRAMLSGGPAEPAATPELPQRKRRRISATGRKAIAEAQRKRWAASRSAAEASSPQGAPKPKRKLSAAGRRAISAATKRRWALKRAEAAKARPAKKTAQKNAAVKKAAVKAPIAKAAKKTARVKKATIKKTSVTTAPTPAETPTPAQ